MDTSRRASHASWINKLPLKSIFQRLPGLWLLLVVPFGIFGAVYFPTLYGIYYTALHLFFLTNNSRSAYGMYVAYNSAKLFSCTDWLEKYLETTGAATGADESHDMPYDHVLHVIILPNYKETMDTLCETLDVLASHTRSITQYKVCLAMEESEPEAAKKAEHLIRLYSDSFYEITFTMHPVGRAGELRGKSSNVAWAARELAKMSGGGIEGRHSHEILTVMDADTCFAEDYFNAVAFYYCTASPEQRRIMMFAPSTVFDRNANNVPVFVRVTDMFWSIGVISNLYSSSSVKIPCSAYSVSMDLAIAVDFWDAGPEAIGEDLHMYLKCLFATRGKVIVQSIFSPASQCNVEGTGEGWSGYKNGIMARYVQAKRHLWGSLDTGYTLRRILVNLIDPESEDAITLKHATVDKLGKDEEESMRIRPQLVVTLVQRLMEAHVLMGHLFIMIILATLFLPVRTAISYEMAAYMWTFISSEPMHPNAELALNVSFWLRLVCLVPNVLMIFYYEMYLRWTGFERWALQERQLQEKGMQRADSAVYLGDLAETHRRHFVVSEANQHLRVQHLGKRASLASPREFPSSSLDWFTIPIAGFLFYVMPQIHAQTMQLITDRLDYKVAAKPQLKSSVPMTHTLDQVTVVRDNDTFWPLPSYTDAISYAKPQIPKVTRSTSSTTLPFTKGMDEYETKSVASMSSKGDEGYFEEFDEVPSIVSQDVVA